MKGKKGMKGTNEMADGQYFLCSVPPADLCLYQCGAYLILRMLDIDVEAAAAHKRNRDNQEANGAKEKRTGTDRK